MRFGKWSKEDNKGRFKFGNIAKTEFKNEKYKIVFKIIF